MLMGRPVPAGQGGGFEVTLLVEDRMSDLIAEQIDVAIRVAQLEDSTLVARKLADNPRVIVASPAYVERAGAPTTPAELAHHECLLWTRDKRVYDEWTLIRGDTTERVRVQGRIRINDGMALVAGFDYRAMPNLSFVASLGYHFKTVSVNGGDEIVEMDRMRKLISGYMVASVQTSAHVQSFIEVDVTNIVKWRDRVKNAFEKREGEKLTFTPIFMEAVAKALKDFPGMNISVDGEFIIKRKNINLGMAAALPNGNLIVPVIKNADEKNLLGITKAVNDLANRARNNQLKPDEVQGGTFTLTNVGTFGNVMGTPIIFQPQVAIMATGAIRKKPGVVETPYGDLIAIRHYMFLSLSYDHRVIDGASAARFNAYLGSLLADFRRIAL